ncbi:hypothetical protein [Megalodesulfovibrio paquesii]
MHSRIISRLAARPIRAVTLTLSLTLGVGLAMTFPLPAEVLAQQLTATTSVDRVFEADGAVQFTSPMGVWQLDYEAGVEANTKALATLQRLAGTGQTITFTYFTDGAARILTKSSVAKLAWMQ